MDEFQTLAGLLVLLGLLLSLCRFQQSTQMTLLAELAVITGMGGPLATVNATLFVSNIPFNKATSVLADFVAVKATWTGSAAKVIDWGSAFIGPGGIPAQESQLLHWICTATPGAPVNNYGVYYDDGTNLLGVDYFAAPVLVAANLDSVQWVASAP